MPPTKTKMVRPATTIGMTGALGWSGNTLGSSRSLSSPSSLVLRYAGVALTRRVTSVNCRMTWRSRTGDNAGCRKQILTQDLSGGICHRATVFRGVSVDLRRFLGVPFTGQPGYP